MADVAMVVANRYDPDPRVQKEARSLVEAGHRVVVYAYDRRHELDPEDEIEGVSVRRIRARKAELGGVVSVGLGLGSFHRRVRRELLERPPDLVHCHDQDTCGVGLWWKLVGARRAGRRGRFVFDAHDLYWTWLLMPNPDARWRRTGAALLRARDRLYARAADLVITTTEGRAEHPGFAEIYREFGCEPLVIWNAPRLPVEVRPLPARFTVGYVGSVRELGMFEELVAAIELMEPAERPALRIAGGGRMQEPVERLLRAAAARLNLELEVTGAFRLDELTELMSQSSVQYSVYPLRRGNMDRALPVKIFDSVAHGRPVIGNADTLMGDWISSKHWGWNVPEGDVAALSRALRAARTGSAEVARGMEPPPSWADQAERLVRAYRFLDRGPA